MVLSAALSLGPLCKYYLNEQTNDYKDSEMIPKYALCIEQLLFASFAFYQCNNYYTQQCLPSLQYFQIVLITLIVIIEKINHKLLLYFLLRIWVILYNLYTFAGIWKESMYKAIVLLHGFAAFFFLIQAIITREKYKHYLHLFWLYSASGYLIYYNDFYWTGSLDYIDIAILSPCIILILPLKIDRFRSRVHHI